jgi:hypothetical protein
MRVWDEDPLIYPCCKGIMKVRGTLIRPEEIEFFLRLHGMWEGIIDIPPPPEPPYNIEAMEPIRVPALWEWADAQEQDPEHPTSPGKPRSSPSMTNASSSWTETRSHWTSSSVSDPPIRLPLPRGPQGRPTLSQPPL